MKIAIIGAGLAGLAAARTLKTSGTEPIIFEKSNAVGGRVSTRKTGDYIWDSGAQNFAPRDYSLHDVMVRELDTTDLIRIEKPIYVHDGRRYTPGDARKNHTNRFAYRQGNNQLAKLLAEPLEIRYNTPIESLKKLSSGKYLIQEEEFDALILTAPIPQTSLLLWSLGIQRPIAQCRYRPCLSIQLGYDFEPPELPFYALIEVNGTAPLQWLGIETSKSLERAPRGCTSMVAQMNPSYSHGSWDWEESKIIKSTATYISWILGPKWKNPVESNVKKWKYSQPEEIAMFEKVNRDLKSKLVVVGDGVIGGRAEYAFESGEKAALQLLNNL